MKLRHYGVFAKKKVRATYIHMSRLPSSNVSTTTGNTTNFSTAFHGQRIVGGSEVTPFEHNWVVLLYAGGYMCAGATLDPRAAHTTRVSVFSAQVRSLFDRHRVAAHRRALHRWHLRR